MLKKHFTSHDNYQSQQHNFLHIHFVLALRPFAVFSSQKQHQNINTSVQLRMEDGDRLHVLIGFQFITVVKKLLQKKFCIQHVLRIRLVKVQFFFSVNEPGNATYSVLSPSEPHTADPKYRGQRPEFFLPVSVTPRHHRICFSWVAHLHKDGRWCKNVGQKRRVKIAMIGKWYA